MNYLHFKLLRTYRVKMKYRMMTGSPRNCILDQAELRQILNQAKDEDIITSKQYDSLWIDNPMIATFYLLPKIHKHATTPPGCFVLWSEGLNTSVWMAIPLPLVAHQ
ncbi:uncharacterized protein LOC130284378 isoform X2 [Hyla sarda]|uniref:uncharacterized protein LOC130284378 isoform X2 n=1 Tax=Hyla sarda TaxID=327740 RepID=UPI0024C2D19B|nr:uncharacterized protein LOC130284378 isoform X2 [Hyla sarda]